MHETEATTQAEPLVHEYYTAVNLVTTVPCLADKLNEHRGCAHSVFPTCSLYFHVFFRTMPAL